MCKYLKTGVFTITLLSTLFLIDNTLNASIKKSYTPKAAYTTEEFQDARFAYETNKEYMKKMAEQRMKNISLDNAIALADDAINKKNSSFFSLDTLADFTGMELFRSAAGMQLITASKELSISQSREINESVLEILRTKNDLNKLASQEYERIIAEDLEQHGYIGPYLEHRVNNEVIKKSHDIRKRLEYNLRRIEEREKGAQIKKEVGKKVKGNPPLTAGMMMQYVKKYGEDKALKEARKDGYRVLTEEEYEAFHK